MAAVVAGDPVVLARTAGEVLQLSKGMSRALAEQRATLSITASSLGNEADVVEPVGLIYDLFLGEMVRTVERLVVVMEQAADGLYQTGSAYQLADEQSATQFGNLPS